MATKKAKAAPTDEELLAQFDDLGEEQNTVKKAAKPAPSKARTAQQQEEADLLAELDNLAQERPKSRPHTPRGSTSITQSASKRTSTSTPPLTAGRTSEEKAPVQSRKSGESTRSFHQGLTPADETIAPPQTDKKQEEPQASSGGWWGAFTATASAAVKQAEALAKEIQKNEEAQRWAEQVKGNVGALRSYGNFLLSQPFTPLIGSSSSTNTYS